MKMHSPPHPGELILATYMKPFGLSCRYLASRLDVSPSTLNRLLKQQSGISPEMALRLSKALGRAPESWLAMQNMYDLWVAEKSIKLDKVQKIGRDAAQPSRKRCALRAPDLYESPDASELCPLI